MINESDKHYIISELERILSKKESILTYKESIKRKVVDSDGFEFFFQKTLKLSNLFDNYLMSTTDKNYDRLYKQVQVCGLSKTWINNIIRKTGIEVLSGNNDEENEADNLISVFVPETTPKIEIEKREEKNITKKTETNASKEIHEPESSPGTAASNKTEIKHKYCNNCRGTIMINSLYCPFCRKVQKMKDCWICKRKIPFSAIYCPFCNGNNDRKIY